MAGEMNERATAGRRKPARWIGVGEESRPDKDLIQLLK